MLRLPLDYPQERGTPLCSLQQTLLVLLAAQVGPRASLSAILFALLAVLDNRYRRQLARTPQCIDRILGSLEQEYSRLYQHHAVYNPFAWKLPFWICQRLWSRNWGISFLSPIKCLPVLNVFFNLLFQVSQPGVSVFDTHNAIFRFAFKTVNFPDRIIDKAAWNGKLQE